MKLNPSNLNCKLINKMERRRSFYDYLIARVGELKSQKKLFLTF